MPKLLNRLVHLIITLLKLHLYTTHLVRALICVINPPLKRIVGSWETLFLCRSIYRVRAYNWDYLFSTNLTVDSMWCAFRHVLDLAIDIVIK